MQQKHLFGCCPSCSELQEHLQERVSPIGEIVGVCTLHGLWWHTDWIETLCGAFDRIDTQTLLTYVEVPMPACQHVEPEPPEPKPMTPLELAEFWATEEGQACLRFREEVRKQFPELRAEESIQ